MQLLVKQSSFWNGFDYSIYQNNKLISKLIWPMWSKPTNSRFSTNNETIENRVQFKIDNKMWSIRYTYLSRYWTNDIQFDLVSPDDTTYASAIIKPSSNKKINNILEIIKPMHLTINRISKFPKQVMELKEDQITNGKIQEEHWLSMSRTLKFTYKYELDLSLACFLIYLSLFLIQSQV